MSAEPWNEPIQPAPPLTDVLAAHKAEHKEWTQKLREADRDKPWREAQASCAAEAGEIAVRVGNTPAAQPIPVDDLAKRVEILSAKRVRSYRDGGLEIVFERVFDHGQNLG